MKNKLQLFSFLIVLLLDRKRGGVILQNETDQKLYVEFLNGNIEAFKELVLKYKNNMIYFITRYVKNIEVAEDISQDVFVYILLHKQNYNIKYSFKTYLYIIAKSRAINYLKKERRIVPIDNYPLLKEEKELEEVIFKKEIQEDVRNGISQLKSDYQVAIYLAEFEELSYQEIAKIMGKTVSQIKTLLHNARKKLKEMLKKEVPSYEKQ